MAKDRESGRRDAGVDAHATGPGTQGWPWPLLHASTLAAMLIPYFALSSGAAALLMLTTVLAALVLVRVGFARVAPASMAVLDPMLAAMSGLAWATVPVMLYPSAQGSAKAVLLAAVLVAPITALSCATRRAAAAFVLPAVASGVWAVLADGGASAPALTLLLVAAGAFVLVAPRAAAPTAAAVPTRSRRDAQDDLVDLLLEGADSSAGDWLWATDEHLRLDGDLDRFAAITGHPALAGSALVAVLAPSTAGAAVVGEAIAARRSFRDVIVEARVPGAAAAWWKLGGKPVFDGNGAFAGYRGVGTDVSALRRAQARIAHLATHDALTGLANRETFQAHADRVCAAAAAGGIAQTLLILDLDGFKQVNDALGHAVGDDLLVAVAATLTRVVPASAVVARLGGDEFAILAAAPIASSGETLARAILEAVSKPFALGAHRAHIGASIGIASAPDHAAGARDLARRADLALYRAKAAGRGCHVVFAETFEREREERARLEADIGLALERNEYALHYQPLLDLAAGQVGACEALIRWTSPTRGAVAPGAFIPAAEGTGLIVAIGRFVLAQACRDAVSWPLPISVAVNISAQHLRSPHFKDDVLAALRGSGLPPSRLEIELTEGVFLDTSRASLDALTWLRERGIKVAIDDFGTGFSSLSYLVNFPVDTIKIDRSFVAGLVDSHQSRAVVDSILTLARTLDVRVVAEGVETREQALALKLRRCDDLQGYLICRPQPADVIGRLMVDLPDALRASVPALLDSSLAAALVMKRSA